MKVFTALSTVLIAYATGVDAAISWTVGQTVRTTSGSVNGHAAAVASGVSEYLGIPYAIPPVGDLRWTPSKAYVSSQTINGSAVGFSCPANLAQFTPGGTSNIANANLTAAGVAILSSLGQIGDRFSEDCLTANVWTKPQVGETGKAVLVWIHGGGYNTGSSGLAAYNGQYIADEEDVVVVSFNYRLNIFGFPGNPNVTQNLGLLDQRLAIEWVRDNVARFGGDPSRITLFGQSAGASSVDHYIYAWTSDPIASSFILESGTVTFLPPNTVPGLGQSTANATAASFAAVAAAAGCTGNSAAQLACIKQLPYQTILASFANATQSVSFGPTIDETVVFSNYLARSAVGNFIKRPILIGNTNYEAGLFKLLGALGGTSQPDSYWNAFNELVFNCPAAARANVSISNNVPTYRYRWFGVFPNTNLTTFPDSGAYHASELPVLFNTAPSPSNGFPSVPANTMAENLIGSYLRGAWAAFAKNPASALPAYGTGWPGYSPNNVSLARLAYQSMSGANLIMGDYFDGACGSTFPVRAINASTASATSSAAPTTTTAVGPAKQSTNSASSVTGSGLMGVVMLIALYLL